MTGNFVLEQETIAPDRRSIVDFESDLQDVYLLPDWFVANTLNGSLSPTNSTTRQFDLGAR